MTGSCLLFGYELNLTRLSSGCLVRVVGKEGALGTGVGGNCSSGMDGCEKITRQYPGRGSLYYSGGLYIL